MIKLSRRKTMLVFFFLLLLIISLKNHESIFSPVFSGKISGHIVLDAGHGFPDGGAVGSMGTIECSLNIKIANKVQKLLEKSGYKVTMTRTGEDSLSSEEKAIAQRKKEDMQNRLKIISDSNCDIFVSIHMNKFTQPRYNGAQVLYSSKFSQSQTLAQCIQAELHKIPENKTKRSIIKAPESIFLMKKAPIPAVIVECGFLSNYDEEKLLQNKDYQKALAQAISRGIIIYYEGIETK